MKPDDPCPCGHARPYRNCCGRWHEGEFALQAPDAEALMRSRYSAYVLGLGDYLLATWHASTRPVAMTPEEAGLRWLGLTVKYHGINDDAHATVEFVARSKLAGRAQRLHEVSRFVCEGGRWFYVDGASG
jgi:SEC-C motif domain protein